MNIYAYISYFFYRYYIIKLKAVDRQKSKRSDGNTILPQLASPQFIVGNLRGTTTRFLLKDLNKSGKAYPFRSKPHVKRFEDEYLTGLLCYVLHS